MSEGTVSIQRPSDADDMVFNTSAGEILRFRANGDILVKGRLIENDLQLTEAFRNFLGIQPTHNVTATAVVRIPVSLREAMDCVNWEPVEYFMNYDKALDRAQYFNEYGEDPEDHGCSAYVVRAQEVSVLEVFQDEIKPGDKVECLDGGQSAQLKVGETYTVDDPGVQPKNHTNERFGPYLSLRELNPITNGTFSEKNGFERFFYPVSRFRKVL